MNDRPGTVESLVCHLVAALAPLRRAVSDEEAFKAFMLRLGWGSAGLPPAYTAIGNSIAEAAAAADALSAEPTPEEIALLLEKASAAYEKITRIDSAPPGVDAAAFLAEIGERLFEILLTDYLASEQPALFNLLSILNVIEQQDFPASADKRAHTRTHFKWQEIPKIVREPMALPERVYGWGTPQLRFQLLAQHVGELLFNLGFPVFIGQADELLAEGYREADDVTPDRSWLLKLPFYYITIAEKNLEAAFTLMELRGGNGELPGIIIQPEIPEEFPLRFQIAPDIDLRLRAGTNAASQFGILIRPGDASIKYPFEPGKPPPAAGIGVGFDFNPAAPTVLFGAPKASRLEFQGASLDFGAQTSAGELDVLFNAQLKKFALVLGAGEGDSFVNSFLGNGETRVEFPLAIEWSRRGGIHFAGSDGFEIALQPHRRLGPLSLDEIAFRLFAPSDHSADLSLGVRTALSGKLGPVAFSIAGMGFRVDTKFSEGNAGPLDLGLGFKPPTGVGLAIDAGVVHGGGFLSFDREKGEYAGALFLELEGGISLTALGLINTRLPGGQQGYSLIVVVTAQGFQPIPLGFGFMLTGIGGLLGVHRTINVEALQGAVRSDQLSGVLAPKDVVAHAAQFLSTLGRFFPAAREHYFFGPLAEITWGTPPLLTIKLALIFEFGERTRLLVLGRITAILPRRDEDLVRLQMNVVGGIDFDRRQAFLDAALFDSRLVNKFLITGEMRLRMRWDDQPFFALAIGGVHPAYTPPPGLEAMQRAAIVFADSENLKLRSEAYLAITSNTVQFGARLDLFAKASKFSISGLAGYDVLIQFDPFHFVAALYASLQLKAGSRSLFKVSFEGELSGPRPLRVRGKATFEILWWDYSVSFNTTLISGSPPPPAVAIDVVRLLREALLQPASWSAALPDRERLVTLREEAAEEQIRIHPLSVLTIKQNVVPLGVRVTKYGNAPIVGGAKEFHVTEVEVGTRSVSTQEVRDHFAPGQYRDMSDDEKLSSPSFEMLQAGVSIGADEPQCGTAVSVAAAFEEIIIPEPRPAESRPKYTMEAAKVIRVSQWRERKRKPSYRAQPIKLAARSRVYKVVAKTDLAKTAMAAEFRTRIEARDAFGKLSANDKARLQIVAQWQ
ncbi:MAG TPA: DUF6603 domain-containing protein [Candidatus Binatia bacterium]|nr:DUF6603 domain-containing protein [Candidatus Binatia bacterium]